MSTIKSNRIENLTTTNGGIDINNSGNVGVGTSSPGGRLHIKTPAGVSGSENTVKGLVLQENSFSSANLLELQNSVGGGLTAFDQAGKLGIGTTSPGQLLHLSSASPRIRLTQTAANSNAFVDAATSGILEFSADDNNVAANSSMRFKVDGSERMRILSGGGLTFNGDTAAANALDDYEEGSFTPGYNSAMGSPSYSVQNGHYTKVGNCVTFTLTLLATGINTGDQLLILGLPFNASSTLENGGATINYFSGNSGNLTQYAHIGKGNNYVSFYLGSGSSWVGVSGDGVSGKTFHLSGFYYV